MNLFPENSFDLLGKNFKKVSTSSSKVGVCGDVWWWRCFGIEHCGSDLICNLSVLIAWSNLGCTASLQNLESSSCCYLIQECAKVGV